MKSIFPDYEPISHDLRMRFNDRAGARHLLYDLRGKMEVWTLDTDKCSLILMFLEIRGYLDKRTPGHSAKDRETIVSIIHNFSVRGLTFQIGKKLADWICSWSKRLRLYETIRPTVARLEFNYFVAFLYIVDLPVFFSDHEIEFVILLAAFSERVAPRNPLALEVCEAIHAYREAIVSDRGSVTWNDWRNLLLSESWADVW